MRSNHPPIMYAGKFLSEALGQSYRMETSQLKSEPTVDGVDPKAIQVVFCTDAKYVQHLAVTLASLLSNNRNNQFQLTIATAKRNRTLQIRLSQIADNFGNASIRFQDFDLERVAHLRTDHHLTVAAYARLFITEFFDASVDKVLYLDSDLIVCRDISPLWNTDISQYALAAVRDHPASKNLLNPHVPPERYFNSGVLLVSLARWRSSGAPQTLLHFAEQNKSKLLWHDQDVLNGVYSRELLLLGPEWNFQARYADCTAQELWLEPEQFAAARNDPGIIHFSTIDKPWNYGAKVPYQNLYFQYLALTPWPHKAGPTESFWRKTYRLLEFDRWKRWIKAHLPKTAHLVRKAISRG